MYVYYVWLEACQKLKEYLSVSLHSQHVSPQERSVEISRICESASSAHFHEFTLTVSFLLFGMIRNLIKALICFQLLSVCRWLFVVFIIIIHLSSSHHFECAYLLKVYFLHIFKIFIVILYCFGLNCLYSSVVRALLSRNTKVVGLILR